MLVYGHPDSTIGIKQPVLDRRILKHEFKSSDLLWHNIAGPHHHTASSSKYYDAAEGPSHPSIHNATAIAFCRHIYPDIWWMQWTTEEALLEGQFSQTARIVSLCKFSLVKYCAPAKMTHKTRGKPSWTHPIFSPFHESFVVWALESARDRNRAIGTPPTLPDKVCYDFEDRSWVTFTPASPFERSWPPELTTHPRWWVLDHRQRVGNMRQTEDQNRDISFWESTAYLLSEKGEYLTAT